MPRPAENVVVAGRFRLNRKLGQGGMGSVWHATQLGLDAPCAIKFIEGEFAALPEMQARFEREAKAAAALRSPHVVQIIDHSLWDGVPFIVMELLDGEDLAHRIERSGRLSPEQTVTVLGQVCRALSKAHALGIIHRDLKPENIYLVRDDDREIAKVLDFGIAKSTHAMETGSSTKTGAMLGTPFYMSPEQAQGTRTVDARSDLWSMAVIAFECMTGRLPFESEALGDLLMKIMVQPLPVPSAIAPVPPAFDAWFARAASREPAGRFQSAKDFIEALSFALLSAGATRSQLGSLAEQSGPHTLVSSGLGPGTDALGATHALGAAPMYGSAPGLTHSSPQAPPPPGGSGPFLSPNTITPITGVTTPKKSSAPLIVLALGATVALVGVVGGVVVAKGRAAPTASASIVVAASAAPSASAPVALGTASAAKEPATSPSSAYEPETSPSAAASQLGPAHGPAHPLGSAGRNGGAAASAAASASAHPKGTASAAGAGAPTAPTAAPTRDPRDFGF